MQILAHRGLWRETSEHNTIAALTFAWSQGFGVELDVRDHAGEVVIAHDPVTKSSASLESLLQLYPNEGQAIAINIKSDGLAPKIKLLLEKYRIENYFTFDMSIPQLQAYKQLNVNFYIPVSELTPNGINIEANGAWLDSFSSIWYDPKVVSALLEVHSSVAVVSSELHRRSHLDQWKMLSSLPIDEKDRLLLCTDFPEEAEAFFNSRNKE